MDPTRVPDRVVALIETTGPFDLLSPACRAELIGELLVEYFEPDERILEYGSTGVSHLYLVESGSVRLVDTVRHRLADLCGEGDTFGAVALLTDDPLPYEAVTAEPTVCALLPAEPFRSLCQAEPRFADFFAESLKPKARAVEVTFDAADARLLVATRVAALVRRKPLTCPPQTTVRQAATLMRDHRAGAILVVAEGQTVGILTDTDLRNKIVAEGASTDTPVDRLTSDQHQKTPNRRDQVYRQRRQS